MKFIAEISANHNGSLENALKLVKKAKTAGATAIKLQTYKPEDLAVPCSYKIKGGLWNGRDLYSLYQEAQTPREWHGPIFEKAKELGLEFGSSVFSPDDVDFLMQFNPDFIKIASFEIKYIGLIEKAIYTNKPVIISTGMATVEDIRRILYARLPLHRVTLLACSSSYPSDDPNVKAIRTLRQYRGLPVGYSDHTKGPDAAVLATVLGARVIEKHICLEEATSLDKEFSATGNEFREMVRKCLDVKRILGTGEIVPSGNLDFLRREITPGVWRRGNNV